LHTQTFVEAAKQENDMPWKKSKTVPGLITHYGRWTKQEENDFYNSVSFEDWRGSGGLIPRGHSSTNQELNNINNNSQLKKIGD
jgi:hypothetical protein